MADPTRYIPGFNYSGWEADHPTEPKPGAELDNDFALIRHSIDETIRALKDVRRSDGKIQNTAVDFDALSPAVKAALAGSEFDYEVIEDLLAKDANLQDLPDKAEARDNLDVPSRSANLSDLTNVAEARSNLGTFSTVAEVQSRHIPPALDSIRTNGYYEPGDGGGAQYRRKSPSEQNHASDVVANDGSRWTIVSTTDLNAKQFGLSVSVSDNERRQALQNAIDVAASLGLKLYIPALVDSNGNPQPWVLGSITITEDGIQKPVCLRWHSGSYIYGDGKGRTILKLADDAIDNVNLFEPSSRDGSVINWVIEDMTLDGNASRPNVSGVGALRRPGASCIATASASFGFIRRVEARHAVLHCIDVCNGGEIENGTEHYAAPGNRNGSYYPDNPSRFVWVEDCEMWDGGDDCWTSHYSEFIYVTRCYAHDAGYRHSTASASSLFEVDDGSRHVWITDCHSERGTNGYDVKGHANEPSAVYVFLTNVSATECNEFLDIHNNSPSWDGHTVHVNGAYFWNPRNIVREKTGSSREIRGVRVERFRNVSLKGLRFYGRSGDTDFKEAVWGFTDAGDILVDDFIFENWADYESTNSSDAAMRFTASAGPVTISNGRMVNCAWRGIRQTGSTAPPLRIRDVAFVGNGKADSIAIHTTAHPSDNGTSISGISVEGYTTALRMGSISYEVATDFIPNYLQTAIYPGSEPATRARVQVSATANVAGIASGSSGTASRDHMVFEDPDNGVIGSITTSGGSTAFNTSSDARGKVDLGEEQGSLARLCAIPVHRARYKSEKPGSERAMLFAQELFDFAPYAVTGPKSGKVDVGIVRDEYGRVIARDVPEPDRRRQTISETIVERGKNGEVTEREIERVVDMTDYGPGCVWEKTGEREVKLMVDHSKLVPELIASIKEMAQRVEALEAQMDGAKP